MSISPLSVAYGHESTAVPSSPSILTSARAGLEPAEYNPTDIRASVAAIFAAVRETLERPPPPQAKSEGGWWETQGTEDGTESEWRSDLGWRDEQNLGRTSASRNFWEGCEWRERGEGEESEGEEEEEWEGEDGTESSSSQRSYQASMISAVGMGTPALPPASAGPLTEIERRLRLVAQQEWLRVAQFQSQPASVGGPTQPLTH